MRSYLNLRPRGTATLALGTGVILGALVFGGTPAATQAVGAITETVSELDEDVRRFCSNIADAAGVPPKTNAPRMTPVPRARVAVPRGRRLR